MRGLQEVGEKQGAVGLVSSYWARDWTPSDPDWEPGKFGVKRRIWRSLETDIQGADHRVPQIQTGGRGRRYRES